MKLGKVAAERKLREPPPPYVSVAKLRAQQLAGVSRQMLTDGVGESTSEEMRHISGLLNTELNRLPADQRHWYNLFKAVDLDDSGVISFHELSVAVRETLRVPRSALSDRTLQSVWLALDEDKSGSIDAGE